MKFGSLVLGTCLTLMVTVARAETIADGDFSGWHFGSYGVGGSARAVVEPAGGSPGARLNVTTATLPADTVYATAVKTDFATTAPLAGTRFTLTLGVLSGDGAFGDGQAIALLVEQNGALYALPLGATSLQGRFATLPYSGTLTAGSFTRVAGGGPAQPVLDGGVATRFGFAAGNSDSLTSTQYYDNFGLELVSPRAAAVAEIDSVAAIPTLSDSALVLLSALLAIAGMGWHRRQRRAASRHS
jgi:hypothetical protein